MQLATATFAILTAAFLASWDVYQAFDSVDIGPGLQYGSRALRIIAGMLRPETQDATVAGLRLRAPLKPTPQPPKPKHASQV